MARVSLLLSTVLFLGACAQSATRPQDNRGEEQRLRELQARGAALSQRMTERAAADLREGLATFNVRMRYYGEEPEKHPSLLLSVPPLPEPLAVPPLPQPLAAHAVGARISEEEALRLIDRLAEDGFLFRGTIRRQKLNVAPPRPYYVLVVEGVPGAQYFEHVAMRPENRGQVARLRDVVEGAAREAFDRVLEPWPAPREGQQERRD